MKTNISNAQIGMARSKAEAALVKAYGPMDVSGEQTCWEGRIARAVTKAQDLIDTGKLTSAQARSLISDFEQQYWTALALARAAQDEYYSLCNQANVAYQPLLRPHCPCPTCAERIQMELNEEYRRALQSMHESKANDETVNHVRVIFSQSQKAGIELKLPVEVF